MSDPRISSRRMRITKPNRGGAPIVGNSVLTEKHETHYVPLMDTDKELIISGPGDTNLQDEDGDLCEKEAFYGTYRTAKFKDNTYAFNTSKDAVAYLGTKFNFEIPYTFKDFLKYRKRGFEATFNEEDLKIKVQINKRSKNGYFSWNMWDLLVCEQNYVLPFLVKPGVIGAAYALANHFFAEYVPKFSEFRSTTRDSTTPQPLNLIQLAFLSDFCLATVGSLGYGIILAGANSKTSRISPAVISPTYALSRYVPFKLLKRRANKGKLFDKVKALDDKIADLLDNGVSDTSIKLAKWKRDMNIHYFEQLMKHRDSEPGFSVKVMSPDRSQVIEVLNDIGYVELNDLPSLSNPKLHSDPANTLVVDLDSDISDPWKEPAPEEREERSPWDKTVTRRPIK